MQKEIIYNADSVLKHPVKLFKSMFKNLCLSGDLAYRLTIRDISARYRQSVLGYAWAILPPILTTSIFLLLNKTSIINVTLPHMPYPIYLFVGVILWQLFTESINAPLRIINQNKSMLTRLSFPHEALLLTGILQVLYDFCIKLIILAIVFIYYNVSVSWGLSALPLIIAIIVLFGTVLGVILVPVGILYEDITTALPLITGLWFFITPVAYPVPSGGALSSIMYWNPVSHLITGGRDWLVTGSLTNPKEFIFIFSLSIVLLLIGWIIYRVALSVLLERI